VHVVKQRQFDVVEQMLNCVWLRPLRYVVVMWCWDFCETPEDAQRLVSCAVSTCRKKCRYSEHIHCGPKMLTDLRKYRFGFWLEYVYFDRNCMKTL